MEKNFMTTQDVIDICVQLYDKGFGRANVRKAMQAWRDNGYWQVTDSDFEKVFDLIVG